MSKRSSYECKYCNKSKLITEFPRESRNKSGYATSCCRKCKSEMDSGDTVIKCRRCSKSFRRDYMKRHMRSEKCQAFGTVDDEKPWRQYKSNGGKIVSCPCESCEGSLAPERTVYRHLKHGSRKESAASLRQRMRKSVMTKNGNTNRKN